MSILPDRAETGAGPRGEAARGRAASAAGAGTLRRAVPWLGAAFIATIIGLSVFGSYRSYRSTVERTGHELDTQARILAEQTERSLQAVDLVMRHLQQEFRRGAFEHMTPQELHEHLREQAVGLVQSEGLVFFNADGDVLAVSSMYPLPQPINVANFRNFQNLKTQPKAGTQIDSVVRSAGDHRWVFPMGRRLETPDGAFAGAVGGRGRVDYYQQFYKDIRLEPGTHATLLHRNGTLMARYPPAEEFLGKRFALLDEMLAAYAAGDTEPRRGLSPIDGVERFAAIAPVPDYPLVMVVTRDTQVALAGWREQAYGSALRTLALSVLASVLLVLAMRQFDRLNQARLSLEAAQERFALAVAGSDDGIWDWDRASGRIFASTRAREILGTPLLPLTEPADEWFSRIHAHPDDEGRRWSALEAHLAGSTPAYEEEFRVQQADGGYRWVGVRGVCVRDAAGAALRMAGSVTDVDARRRAEEALRESEERFALAVAGSKDGIIDWDIANDRLFASPRALEVLGIASDRTIFTAEAWRALVRIHPDDLARFAAETQARLQGHTDLRENEYRVLHPGGTHRWVRLRGSAVIGPDGQAVRWAGSVRDIDAQKRTEQALRLSEERYQLAVAGSNEGLWDWDLKTDMMFMSARAQSLFGLEPGEPLRPRRDWAPAGMYHPDDRETVRLAFSAHLRGRTPHLVCEYRVRHASGDWHWYRQRGIAVRDAHGQPYRLAGSIEDVTNRHLAEAEHDRLEVQLRQAQKLEAIGTLAGGIAHDFNNILSAILGYGEMAQMQAAEGTVQRRHIDATLSAAQRAKSLVERILAFSRSGVGERVPVHVESVVAEALELVRASLPPGVTLEQQLAIGNASLLGDPTQIHQVVMNLCANAVQAMRSAGTIRVGAEPVVLQAPQVVATVTLAPGRYVRLSVSDSGVGIAPQVLERIFDPFYTTKEVGVGTGLGLSLVHGIVTDLGGGIDVRSRLGEGAVFTVWLPWQRDIPAPQPVDSPLLVGAGETVLLVDDEEPLVRMGEEMMAELGYEPVGFASSTAALASFRATPERFSIVVSDEAMPEMTGSEMAREMRRIRPDLPIVLMSGYVSPALAERARALGVVEVLSKPLAMREIARSLSNALHR